MYAIICIRLFIRLFLRLRVFPGKATRYGENSLVVSPDVCVCVCVWMCGSLQEIKRFVWVECVHTCVSKCTHAPLHSPRRPTNFFFFICCKCLQVCLNVCVYLRKIKEGEEKMSRIVGKFPWKASLRAEHIHSKVSWVKRLANQKHF